MNGGLTECSRCGCDLCRCETIKQQKQQQRVKDGKVALESVWRAMVGLPRWKRKIIIWLWPDIIYAAEDLKEYYWREDN